MIAACHAPLSRYPLQAQGDSNLRERWRRYRRAGFGSAHEEELVRCYLPLVKSVVGRMAISFPPHVDGDDLHSAGLVGLLNAVRQFKPRLGTAFESYARLRVRGAVLDELRRMDWVPRSVHAKARKVQAVMTKLEQARGRLPTEVEMAGALKIPVRRYRQWLDKIRPVTFICLDAVPADEHEDNLSEHEMLCDETQGDAADHAARADLARLIAARITQLPPLPRKVIALYYYQGLLLREIAQICGLCESRICQIHTQAILAIKAHLKQHESRPFRCPGLTIPRSVRSRAKCRL